MKYLLSGRRAVILRMSLVIMLVLFGMMNIAGADNSGSHEVTVEVESINEITITGGNIPLTIDFAAAGQSPEPDTGTCLLEWTTNEDDRDITVGIKSSLPTNEFTLTVEAIGITGSGNSIGSANYPENGMLTLIENGVIQYSTILPWSLIIGISKACGSCSLEYTLSVLVTQEPMQEDIEVTYTITGP